MANGCGPWRTAACRAAAALATGGGPGERRLWRRRPWRAAAALASGGGPLASERRRPLASGGGPAEPAAAPASGSLVLMAAGSRSILTVDVGYIGAGQDWIHFGGGADPVELNRPELVARPYRGSRSRSG